MKQLTRRLQMRRWSFLVALAICSVNGPTAVAETKLNIAEFRGKVLVVDFWASWCVPCRRSFPWMNEMQKRYGDEGLVIIGVNLDADPEEAESFLREVPANFRILRDPEGDLAKSYDVIAMPSSFVFDRNGEVAKKHHGFKVRKQDEYEAILVDLLRQSKESG